MKKNKKSVFLKSLLSTLMMLSPVMSMLTVHAEHLNDTAVIGFDDSNMMTLANVFADNNLAKGVAEKLHGNENIDILVTREELESIISLDVQNKNIQDLSGIEYLINLTTLNLRNNHIRDIGALSDLVELELLDLNNNEIQTITALSKLVKLRVLLLAQNQLSDLRVLSELPNLDLTLLNVENQVIVLPEGVQGRPTDFVLANHDGTIPEITFIDGVGVYDISGQLQWSTYGENKLQWRTTGFSGTLSQNVIEQISTNLYKQGMWTSAGLLLEGVISKTGVDSSGTVPVTKTLQIVAKDTDDIIVDNIDVRNIDVYGSMDGYDVLIPNDILRSLASGTYRLFVTSVIGNDTIREPITQASTGEGLNNQPAILDESRENAEDLGYMIIGDNIINVTKLGDEVVLCVSQQIVSFNEFVLGYWSDLGLVLEGAIGKTGVDGSGNTPMHKTLQIVSADNENQIVESIVATNVPWFGTMEGYQAIIPYDILESLEIGKYRLFVESVVGEDVIREPITQISTGEGQSGQPGVLDLYCYNAEDLGYMKIQDTIVEVGKLGNEVILDITSEVISRNDFVLGYWSSFGLVLEGAIGKTGVDGSGNTPMHKTLQIVSADNENQIVESIVATNVPWFGTMEGYQAIIPYDVLEPLEIGKYRLFVESVVGEDVIREPITQISTGAGQSGQPGVLDLYCYNAEDLGYMRIKDTIVEVGKLGNEVILDITSEVISKNDFVLGYWSDLGLVLEGVISRTGVDGTGNTPIHKTLQIVCADDENQIIESIAAITVDWFGTMEGYQAIIPYDVLESLEIGQYRLFVESVVGEDVIRAPITQISTGEGQSGQPGVLDLYCYNAEDLGYMRIQDTIVEVGKLGNEVVLSVTREILPTNGYE